MVTLAAAALRYGLHVLVVGTVCCWYVSDDRRALPRSRRLAWMALALTLGVGGVRCYLGARGRRE